MYYETHRRYELFVIEFCYDSMPMKARMRALGEHTTIKTD